jgi:hypothetical protein
MFARFSRRIVELLRSEPVRALPREAHQEI